MIDNSKIDELKVTALLEEYGHLRREVRQWEVLQVICIILAQLAFVVMFTIGIVFSKHLLLFVSPAISIFFIVLGMGMLAYNNNLGIRSNQVSSQLRKILKETTIDWENTVGIFGSVSETIFTKRIGRFWWLAVSVGIIVGIAPTIFAMWYSFEFYMRENIFYVILTDIAYLITIAMLFVIFYKIMNWQKMKFKDQIGE